MAAILLLLCGAALADEPAPTPADDGERNDGERDDDERADDEREVGEADIDPAAEVALPPATLRPWLGATAGVGLSNHGLGGGFLPSVQAGLVLPVADERLRPHLSLSWTAPVATVRGEDPTLAEGWTARIRQEQLRVGLGLFGRILDRRAPVSPELLLRGELSAQRTTTETSSGGTVLSTAREHGLQPAGTGGVGLCGALGPGQLAGGVALSLSPSRGDLTGDVLLTSVDLTLGYRLEL
ncbi:MAG: hypothetical protein H6742_01355 [Alphaproteobacteria bacterium]|nr:hypothetical protein [Alphaproteobacteria bacterium]